jgi:hypothetical protein
VRLLVASSWTWQNSSIRKLIFDVDGHVRDSEDLGPLDFGGAAQQGRDGKKDCGFPHRIDFTTMREAQTDLQWNHGVKGRSSLPRDAVVEIGRPAR